MIHSIIPDPEKTMYAVLSSGGKQYRVEPGSTLTIEKLTEEAGASVTFDRVLLVADGDDVMVGTPTVSGATIAATILGAELGPKIVVFKFKQKAKYRRRTGHRQHLTRIRIDEISANGRSERRTETAESPEAKAPKAKAAKVDATTKSEAEAAPEAKAAPKVKAAPKASATKANAAKAKAAEAKAAEAEAESRPAAKPRARRNAASAADDAPKKPATKRAAKPKPAKE
ncbi:MAG: 50S ribosomal protein L21 [Chloroflexota bacterium]